MTLPLEARLAQSWPPGEWRDVTVLVAVSGGADSVALVRALAAVRPSGAGRLAIAHFNHRLRGSEADEDEQFVRRLAQELAMPCEVGYRRDAEAEAARDGLEAAARAARYRFLEAAAGRLGARYVAVAHSADDQVETILQRILRGTGLAGLAGMPRIRPLSTATLIRPLLGVRRAELVAYLQEIGQDYRRDATNADLHHTRNRLRCELLPHLTAEYNPQLAEALLRLGNLAGEAQAVIAGLVDHLVDRHVRAVASGGVSIDCRALAGQPRYLVRELLVVVWRGRGWPEQSMGFAEWDALAELILAPAPTRPRPAMFPGAVTAARCGDHLELIRA